MRKVLLIDPFQSCYDLQILADCQSLVATIVVGAHSDATSLLTQIDFLNGGTYQDQVT